MLDVMQVKLCFAPEVLESFFAVISTSVFPIDIAKQDNYNYDRRHGIYIGFSP